MAFENLLITVKRRIGGIKIDGVISESTQRTVRVTTNPVENGFNISDHVIEEPVRYTMQGVITDTPLGAAAFSELAGSVVDAATGLFGKSESSGVTRSKQAYSELVALMQKRELITVNTTLKKYEDLIFESIIVNANATNANSISFTASFVQVLQVRTARQSVDSDNITDDAEAANFSNKNNNGFNGAPPATDLEISSITRSGGL